MKLNDLHTDQKDQEKAKEFLRRHPTKGSRGAFQAWVTPATSATPPTRTGKPKKAPEGARKPQEEVSGGDRLKG